MRNVLKWLGLGAAAVAVPAVLLVPSAGAAPSVGPTPSYVLTTSIPGPPQVCIRRLAVGDMRSYEGTRTRIGDDPYSYASVPVTSTGCGRAGQVTFSLIAGSATPGLDYVAATGTLQFAAGSTDTVWVPVRVFRDHSPGPNETVGVYLSAPSIGFVLADPYGIGNILNDDTFCVPPPEYLPPPPPMSPDYHCSE